MLLTCNLAGNLEESAPGRKGTHVWHAPNAGMRASGGIVASWYESGSERGSLHGSETRTRAPQRMEAHRGADYEEPTATATAAARSTRDCRAAFPSRDRWRPSAWPHPAARA